MLETAFAQLRFAASVVFGVPFSARSLDRIVDGLIATQREFGAIGSAGAELLGVVRVTFPVMIVLEPLMIAQYLYWWRRRGQERATWQYLQAEPLASPAGIS